MNHKALLLLLSIILFGCRPNSQPDSSGDASPTPRHTSVNYDGVSFVQFQVHNIEIKLPLPLGWEHYETDYGVVMTEYIGSVASDGQLDGLLVHVFVPPLDQFSAASASEQNLAWDILHDIIEDPAYIGSATPSDPVGFTWNNQPAAYYLMDNGEGNPTIVLGVIAPGTRKMVACSISAPQGQIERIRRYLPVLMDGLMINDTRFDGRELDTLPNPFDFPEHNKSTKADQSVS